MGKCAEDGSYVCLEKWGGSYKLQHRLDHHFPHYSVKCETLQMLHTVPSLSFVHSHELLAYEP